MGLQRATFIYSRGVNPVILSFYVGEITAYDDFTYPKLTVQRPVFAESSRPDWALARRA